MYQSSYLHILYKVCISNSFDKDKLPDFEMHPVADDANHGAPEIHESFQKSDNRFPTHLNMFQCHHRTSESTDDKQQGKIYPTNTYFCEINIEMNH